MVGPEGRARWTRTCRYIGYSSEDPRQRKNRRAYGTASGAWESRQQAIEIKQDPWTSKSPPYVSVDDA